MRGVKFVHFYLSHLFYVKSAFVCVLVKAILMNFIKNVQVAGYTKSFSRAEFFSFHDFLPNENSHKDWITPTFIVCGLTCRRSFVTSTQSYKIKYPLDCDSEKCIWEWKNWSSFKIFRDRSCAVERREILEACWGHQGLLFAVGLAADFYVMCD